MAYLTGTATSMVNLLSTLKSALTANGYTVDGDVVHKGTLFAEIIVTEPNMFIQGGTGISGGVLSGRSDYQASVLGYTVSTTNPDQDFPVVFPLTYHIHVNSSPDEVYLIINYNVNYYQYLAFGKSDTPGLLGSGNWYAASFSSNYDGDTWNFSNAGGGYTGGQWFNCALFDGLDEYGCSTGAVNHGLDGRAWNYSTSYHNRWPVLANTPSQWNEETVLVPIVVTTRVTGGFETEIMQMRHVRSVMLDNLEDGQVVTFGTDKWKVYPLWRRSPKTLMPFASTADGGGGTGFLGQAFRYDGA